MTAPRSPAGAGVNAGRYRAGGVPVLVAGISAVAAVLAGVAVGRGDGVLVAVGAAAVAFVIWTLTRPEHAALGVLVVLPFLIYPVSTGGLSLFAGVPLVVLVSLALMLAQRRSLRRLRRRLPATAFAVLFAIACAAAAHSVSLSTAGSRLVYLALFALFAWALASSMTAGRLSTRAVAISVVTGSALASVALIAQVVAQFAVGRQPVITWLGGQVSLFAGQRGAAIASQSRNWTVTSLNVVRGIFPFMSAPSAGQYTMLGLVTAVWLWRTRARATRPATPAESSWIAFATGLTFAGLLMTLSRQSWVGALVGIGALGIRRDVVRPVVLVAVLLLLLAITPIPGGHSTFAGYLLEAGNTSTTSSATRLGLLSQAIHLIPGHWLLGVGPGLYGTLNPDPLHPVYYAHNVWLDEAVELGVAGGLALISVFVATMRSAFRRRAMLGFSLLAAYAVANMFDDVLYFPRNGILLAAAFAIAAAGDGRWAERLAPRRGATAPAPQTAIGSAGS